MGSVVLNVSVVALGSSVLDSGSQEVGQARDVRGDCIPLLISGLRRWRLKEVTSDPSMRGS